MMPSAPGSSLDAFIWSIGQQESGGNYNIGDSSSGAIGKYQLLPSNIIEWSREMGNPVTVAQFRASPALQEKIARWKLSQFVNKYGYAGAAAAWYSGSPNPNSNVGNPPVHQYVSEVLNRMSQFPGSGTGQAGIPGGINAPIVNPLNPADWVKGFTGMLGVGDLKDMFERLGLILFGGLLVIMGFHILAGPTTEKVKTAAKQFVGVGGGEGESKTASKSQTARKVVNPKPTPKGPVGGKVAAVQSVAKVAGI